jgi:hypothetical protein
MSLEMSLDAASCGHWTVLRNYSLNSISCSFDVLLHETKDWTIIFPDGKCVMKPMESKITIHPSEGMNDMQKRCL